MASEKTLARSSRCPCAACKRAMEKEPRNKIELTKQMKTVYGAVMANRKEKPKPAARAKG